MIYDNTVDDSYFIWSVDSRPFIVHPTVGLDTANN